MSSPIRVGVLGASGVSRRRMLPALRDDPGTAIAAIASRDPAKAGRFAAEFGGEAVHGYQALLSRDDVDAVYISVPNALHHRWTAAALAAGKHVLCEKPLTTRAEDTRELLAAAAERQLVLRDNFAFVHHGQHRAVRELIGGGRLGEVRHVSAAFCFPPLPAGDVRYRPDLGGGALLDTGVYGIRLAQLLLGDDLAVAGAALRVDPATGVDVSGSALLTSPGGVMVHAMFGFVHNYGAFYQVWGSAARLTVDRPFTPPAGTAPVLRIDEQNHAEELVLPAEEQYGNGVAAFAAAICAGWADGHATYAATAERTAEIVDRVALVAVRTAAG
jgi:NDP-hexose-3-ketoreductase